MDNYVIWYYEIWEYNMMMLQDDVGMVKANIEKCQKIDQPGTWKASHHTADLQNRSCGIPTTCRAPYGANLVNETCWMSHKDAALKYNHYETIMRDAPTRSQSDLKPFLHQKHQAVEAIPAMLLDILPCLPLSLLQAHLSWHCHPSDCANVHPKTHRLECHVQPYKHQ